MYLEFYGLKSKPFGKTPDPEMLFLSRRHEEALARMEQAVEDRELLLLTGEIGSGKTTLSRCLIDRLPENYKPALIINPRLSPNQLLRTVARRLGIENPRYFKSDLLEQIFDALFQSYEKQLCPVLIIDEAHLIPGRESFEEVRLLTNMQLDKQNLMSVILIGQPELNRRLEHPVYEPLRQRIGIRYHLGPLDQGELGEYIDFRLKKAGRDKPLFTPEALELLWVYSGGIPRRINNIAANALIEGFAREAGSIGENVVQNVIADLGIEPVIKAGKKNQKQMRRAG
jgi:type II secretory pathway predicted ATPase ExeA